MRATSAEHPLLLSKTMRGLISTTSISAKSSTSAEKWKHILTRVSSGATPRHTSAETFCLPCGVFLEIVCPLISPRRLLVLEIVNHSRTGEISPCGCNTHLQVFSVISISDRTHHRVSSAATCDVVGVIRNMAVRSME